MQIEIITADRLPLSVLTGLWNEGFADYYLPMQLTPQRLLSLVLRESISLPDSLIALVDGEPVGFVLTSIRWRNSQMVAYDAGTAVVREFRQQGVAKSLLTAFLQRLSKIGVEEVALTVALKNDKATKLYKQLGFSPKRYLTCYSTSDWGPWQSQLTKGLSIRAAGLDDVRHLVRECYQQEPEWQNQASGYKLRNTRIIIAEVGDIRVGYACFLDNPSPYLLQLGVTPNYRCLGIGQALLRHVQQQLEQPRLTYLNHPQEEGAGEKFLQAMGFRPFFEQLEMVRPIQSSWKPRLAQENDMAQISSALSGVEGFVHSSQDDATKCWFLADDDGKPIAVACAELSAGVALLSALWVRTDQRGQGIGRRLLKHLERWLYSKGVEHIYLLAAHYEEFFRHQGYVSIRREQIPVSVHSFSPFRCACPFTAIIMRKEF